MRKALIFACLALTAASADASPPPKELSILRMTPAGDDVPGEHATRQIVLQFNRPVVPIGRMERTSEELPIGVQPPLVCDWRWLNTSALACNLGESQALRSATTYRVEVKPGIKAEDGGTLSAPFVQTFITARPDVRQKSFLRWTGPTHPAMRLVFNQPVTSASAKAHLFFNATGKTGAEARVAVLLSPDRPRKERNFLGIVEHRMVALFRSPAAAPDDQVVKVGGDEARRIWRVEPATELLADTDYALTVEPGLVSSEGPELGNETRSVADFATFPDFRVLNITCRDLHDNDIVIAPGETFKGRCDPLGPKAIHFTTPVDHVDFMKAVRITPPPPGWKHAAKDEEADDGDAEVPEGEGEDVGDDEGEYGSGPLYRAHDRGDDYTAWLNGYWKATVDYRLALDAPSQHWWSTWLSKAEGWFRDAPEPLRDAFGRTLAASAELHFGVDHRKPNFELPTPTAVLEKNADSEVPLYVNNLNGFSIAYRSLGTDDHGVWKTDETTLHKKVTPIEDIQYAVPLDVREVLNHRSGAFYGYFDTSPREPTDQRLPLDLFGQVTPWQFQLKFGHFSTLAWVTDLATGKPVPGVTVSVHKQSLEVLGIPPQALATATTDAGGVALLPGSDQLDPELDLSRYPSPRDPNLIFYARKGEDMAMLPAGSNFLIDNYRVTGGYLGSSEEKKYGHMQSWGTTAQGIYRLGDMVDYKLYVRQQDNHAFIPAPTGEYTLTVTDPGGKEIVKQQKIVLNEFGAFAGQLTVPKNGLVGWYDFSIEGKFEQSRSFSDHPLKVLIADFTPAPFHVKNELNGDLFHGSDSVDVDTLATLHAGGPYTSAATRITAVLKPQALGFIEKWQKDGYTFGETGSGERQIYQNAAQLDGKGEGKEHFTIPADIGDYGRLMVESAVADERGKFVTSQAYADYVDGTRFIGLKARDWLTRAGSKTTIDAIILDERGKPVPGATSTLLIERKETKAARVKGAGNAYLYRYTESWIKAGSCRLTAAEQPVPCDFTPDKAGSYRATAEVKDDGNHIHKAEIQLWVTGPDAVLWDEGNQNGLDLLPEKASYKVGETARFLVKNPYPNAHALITVERYGVLDHFERELQGSTPVVEIPVKEDYLPGFFVSVSVFSPRVEKPPVKVGEVDLGKPAMRMGYASVEVEDEAKRLDVTAKSDRPVYRPGDTVTLTLHAEARDKSAQSPTELAVVVLDDSVFDLIAQKKEYFDPYHGFYHLDGLDLRNYSLIERLIGRQKFEKKGANPGGDGGADLAMRSVFKFVSYWNPSLKTDAQGNATASFTLPDNLTGWHVLALAATKTDRFGLGEAQFKVNRPTELRPVMPNQVMEGDRFTAGFSVMNRTDHARDVTVTVKAEGTLKNEPGQKPVAQASLHLEPYKRENVWLKLEAGSVPEQREIAQGGVTFTATAGDKEDKDGMAYALPVKKRRPMEVGADYASVDEPHFEQSVAWPKDIRTDTGHLDVVLSPSVIGNVSGAFKYIRDYLYWCWEQRMTKAVMAAHFTSLHDYLPPDMTWDEAKTLPQRMLDDASGFQAENGGMTYWDGANDHVDPYLSAFTGLAFDWLGARGYHVQEGVESHLHDYLLDFVRKDTAPKFYNAGLTSSVRAVMLSVLAHHHKVEAADLDRYMDAMPRMSLFGKAQMLAAATELKAPAATTKKIVDDILSHASQTGGKFLFNDVADDGYKWMLTTPLRDNCAILDSMVDYAKTPEGKLVVADVPMKLVRTITQARGTRDHWENTQENLFCLNALIDYAKVYEATPPVMQVKAAIGDEALGEAAFKTVRDPAVTLTRETRPGDEGKKASVTLDRDGQGRYYVATRLFYAPTAIADKPVNAGMVVKREYSVKRDGKWQLLKPPYHIVQGDVVRVDLYASLPTARFFVVLDDPVPGGLEPVNRDLATASKVDADEGSGPPSGESWWYTQDSWQSYAVSRWSFYHQELKHDAVRYYSDYLAAGNYHLSYTAQAIAEGNFAILPLRAEEMYEPDVYGRGVEETLVVDKAP